MISWRTLRTSSPLSSVRGCRIGLLPLLTGNVGVLVSHGLSLARFASITTTILCVVLEEAGMVFAALAGIPRLVLVISLDDLVYDLGWRLVVACASTDWRTLMHKPEARWRSIAVY